jgi:hypothetical protein
MDEIESILIGKDINEWFIWFTQWMGVEKIR